MTTRTCLEPDCDAPRLVSARGRVYQRCAAHEKVLRHRLHVEAGARRVNDRLSALARRMGWPETRLVSTREADAELRRIAELPRELPTLCGACFAWHMWTGQYRECRCCKTGREVLAENEEYRTPPRKLSDWTSNAPRHTNGGRLARRARVTADH